MSANQRIEELQTKKRRLDNKQAMLDDRGLNIKAMYKRFKTEIANDYDIIQSEIDEVNQVLLKYYRGKYNHFYRLLYFSSDNECRNPVGWFSTIENARNSITLDKSIGSTKCYIIVVPTQCICLGAVVDEKTKNN